MEDTLVEIFMWRDRMTREAAEELLKELRADVAGGADPEDVLYDIGLEPDYFWELV